MLTSRQHLVRKDKSLLVGSFCHSSQDARGKKLPKNLEIESEPNCIYARY